MGLCRMLEHEDVDVFFDALLNQILLSRETILNHMGNNFSRKTCD